MLPTSKAIQEYLEPTATLIKIERYLITVKLRDHYLPVAERGHQLLELEKVLRREVDPRIEVFLEPQGDLNKLRVKLRGVKL